MPDPAKRERAIFEGALELSSAGERRAYLSAACGDDAELRKRVEALLRAHEQAGGFLPEDNPNPGTVRTSSALLPVTEKPGDRIGRYKLREKIGEGGCGVVYVAEQEEPVRRRVALKVIKLGMDTRSVMARFEAERQALAIMDHPNIAKVLDAGATETGRPFFVMELVRGIRITEYCDQKNLSTRDRLDLFIKVCQAVQHAHQKGIIHRDIKPSNILVTLHDGVPVPKIIDFGIAKATEGRLTDLTVYTELNQFIGTPAYMSPEQAEMSGLAIDTRSDIYSLGVLLYELLTSQPPFNPEELLRRGIDEIRRTIREVEPPRPSTRLSTLVAASLSDVAHHRHTEAPKLLSLIRGDLDWIVMKCLEKDRARRYETANELALDIGRHLAQEPVTACPPGAAYRFGKFVRRNKFAFAAGSAVAAALIAGLAAALLALARERAANERAEQQRRLAEQRLLVAVRHVEGFLTNVMEVRKLPGSTHPVERMLQDTLTFMDALAPNAADNPEFLLGSARVHANLAMLQGNRYMVSLGDPETALASASNAWTLLSSIPTGALPRVRVQEMTFRAEQASGVALQALGREDEALAHYERMLILATGLDQQLPRTGNRRWTSDGQLGDCRWTSEAHAHLGAYFRGKKKWEQSREHYDHLLRDPYLLTNAASEDLSRLNFTGGALWARAYYYRFGVSNLNMALGYFRQSLSFSEAHLKRANSDQTAEFGAVMNLVHIGIILCEQRNHAEGPPIIDEALRRMESLAVGDKANWNFQDVLTEFLRAHAKARAAAASAGEFSSVECPSCLEQARTSYQRCLERMNASAANSRQKSWVVGGVDDVKRGLEEVEADLVRTYRRAGRLDDAEAIYRERLAGTESSLTATLNLGELLLERARTNTQNPSLAQKQKSEGEQLLRDARKRYANDPAMLEEGLRHLAEARYRHGDFAEAEPLYREILQSRHARLSAGHESVLNATAGLGRFLTDWAWAERPERGRSPSTAGTKAREAEKLLRECLALRLRGANSSNWRTAEAKSRLGGALVSVAVADPALNAEVRVGKLAEAESLLLEGNERLQPSSAENKYKRDAVERLVRLYEAWGKRDKVSEWQRKLETFDKTGDERSPSEEQTQ
jgi:hypothetical protein